MPRQKTFTAVVPGNSGRVRTELRIVEVGQGMCSLKFNYGGTSYASHESDFTEEHSTEGGPIHCSKASILELGLGLEGWLEKGELFSWNSGGSSVPFLTLALCRPEGMITRADKPAFACTYENSTSFYSSWIYIVDQSCLREAAEVLRDLGVQSQIH